MVNFSHQNGICHSTNMYRAVLWAAHPMLSYPVNRYFSSVIIRKADREMLSDPLLGSQLGPAEGGI